MGGWFSLRPQVSRQNSQESGNSKLKPGLPGHCEGIFVKAGGWDLFLVTLCRLSDSFQAMNVAPFVLLPWVLQVLGAWEQCKGWCEKQQERQTGMRCAENESAHPLCSSLEDSDLPKGQARFHQVQSCCTMEGSCAPRPHLGPPAP